ncbi:MAG: excinuclease ABC subunit UvrA, partial [Planctomycetota bacterium]
SGSGKSSLAFDTIHAEGKRQYTESLSTYARQFLDQISRPDVDFVEGLQPTLCIDQRPGTQNPRSTVATVTEIYDYLRLLMARLGTAYCFECGSQVRQQSVDQIVDRLLLLPEGTKTMILAPLVRGRRGAHKEVVARVRKAGLVRMRVDGLVCDIDHIPEIVPQKVHHLDAVVDRVIIREGIEDRLTDSVRLALEHGENLVSICYLDEDVEEGEEDNALSTDNGVAGSNGIWRDELFSTSHACPNCNVNYEEIEPRTFSFNSPYGACPVCDGLGISEAFDPQLVIPDPSLSLGGGAIAPLKGTLNAKQKEVWTEIFDFLQASVKGFDEETPLDTVPDDVMERMLNGDEGEYLGLLCLLEKQHATTTHGAQLKKLQRFRANVMCGACEGTRLRREALSVKLGGRHIGEIGGLSVEEAVRFFSELEFDENDELVARPLVDGIQSRLSFLLKVGVDYLTLNRSADTLSGGEFQRVRLATAIGSGLVGVCYILDEPSIGLHARDNRRLIDSLLDLKSQGNTVLVVEHDEAVMREADWLIDMGPGSGADGGNVVAEGHPDHLIGQEDSITARYLGSLARIEVPSKRRRTAKTRSLVLQGVSTHNLQEVDVRFPLGVLLCVTGVSGSGKSSLINQTLAPALLRRLGQSAPTPGPFKGLRGLSQIDKVIQIDQSPIGRSPRSNAATYTGVFDEIRKVFAATRDAKQRGYTASRFSFNNREGRCEACQGHGVQKIEMTFLPDLYVTCDQCGGARFNEQTLVPRYRGKSIAEVLDMRIRDAAKFFENFAAIARVLDSLDQVGLGYLPLGQPSTTLSGGEAQRVKLATELSRSDTKKTLYLLDEPTTGLHFEDIRRLLSVLQQLVDRGNTVLVIEHNLDVIKCADWVIDLGPEGGTLGGQIVAEGTPESVAGCDGSYTGMHLAGILEGGISSNGHEQNGNGKAHEA